MTFEEYQQETARTWRSDLPDELSVIALGIAGEAGEVADIVKKVRGHGKTLDAQSLLKEVGDVLYYLTRAAAFLGSSLSQVAQTNVDKLRARHPNGFTVESAAAKADERPPIPPEPDASCWCDMMDQCRNCQDRAIRARGGTLVDVAARGTKP